MNPDEPMPDVETPDPPAQLVGEGLIEWGRMSELLENAGLITHLDRAVLFAYCSVWAKVLACEDILREEGPFYMKQKRLGMDDQGNDIIGEEICKHPVVIVHQEYLRQLKSFLTEFGLSPASRAKVSSGSAKGKETEKAKRRREILG